MDRLKLGKTRWTWSSSRDDLIDLMKIQRIESHTEILSTINQKTKNGIQTFRDFSENPKHSKLEIILPVMEFQITTIKIKFFSEIRLKKQKNPWI